MKLESILKISIEKKIWKWQMHNNEDFVPVPMCLNLHFWDCYTALLLTLRGRPGVENHSHKNRKKNPLLLVIWLAWCFAYHFYCNCCFNIFVAFFMTSYSFSQRRYHGFNHALRRWNITWHVSSRARWWCRNNLHGSFHNFLWWTTAKLLRHLLGNAPRYL